MAVHRPIRKTARLPLHAHRRGRKALQRRPAHRGHAADTDDHESLDERFSTLATYIRAGNLYECAWQLLKHGHFNGQDDGAAALALGNWALRNQIHLMFEVRRVREHDVLYVLMRDKRQ